MNRVVKFAIILIVGGLIAVLIASGCVLFVDYDAMDTRPLSDARAASLRQIWLDSKPSHYPNQRTNAESGERYGTGLWMAWLGEDDPALEHSLVRIRSGWPWPCLEGFMWRTQSYAPDPTLPGNRLMITGNTVVYDRLAMIRRDRVPIITMKRSKLLPYGPIPTGLILNALLYGFILLLLWKAMVGWRRHRLRRAGRCPACGYQLNDLPRCPECGAERWDSPITTRIGCL